MEKKPGKKKYWPWGIVLFALLGAVIVYRSFRIHKISGWRDPVVEMHDQKITELGRKAKDLIKLIEEAEKTGDKIRYRELAKVTALNQIELDGEWQLLHEALRAQQLRSTKQPKGNLPDSAAFNVFSEQEKLEMLTQEYAVDLESLRLLKAQIGIMFSNEFRGRFLEEIHDTLTYEDFRTRDLKIDSR